jgi:hypothetical protein
LLSVRLAADYIHPTPQGGRCRIRLYLPDEEQDAPVVVCTEPPKNPGVPITYAVEHIAAEVIAANPLLETPFIWIEHYEDRVKGTPSDPATFDRVTFSSYEVREVLRGGEWRKEIGAPNWKALDRASVEALIGGPL